MGSFFPTKLRQGDPGGLGADARRQLQELIKGHPYNQPLGFWGIMSKGYR